MTKKYETMKSVDKKIDWTLEELKKLTNDKNSQVHLQRTKRHIALHPYHLTDLKKSLHEILGSEVNHYNYELRGLLLAYKNPKLLSKIGSIFYDAPFIHVDVEADFYIFRPEINSTLKGIVNKKAENHIGVLVHKAFNVSIRKKDEDEENWLGHHLNVGDVVKFIVQQTDFKGKLPFIRGQLVASNDESECIDDNSNLTCRSKKSKKHKFTDEELNFDHADSPAKTIETESVDNKSNLNGQKILNGSQKNSSNIETTDSSDDSDSEPKVFTQFVKKKLPKKSSKHSEVTIQGDVTRSSKKKPVSVNSKEKSAEEKLIFEELGQSSDASSSDNFFKDSIKLESPKKLEISKNKKICKSDNSINEKVAKNSNAISRKRKHSELQHNGTSDELIVEKKVKNEKEIDVVESGIIERNSEEKSLIPEEIPKYAHNMSETEENSAENTVESVRKEKKSKVECKRNKEIKNKVILKDTEESDDDMSHFLPLRKIKVERNEDNSSTITIADNCSETTKIARENINNYQDESASQNECLVKKKSKKKKKDTEDYSIQALVSVESIKKEGEKSRKAAEVTPKLDCVETEKIRKAEKKSKKLKKSDASQKEEEIVGIQKIKKEKDECVIVKSPKILNLQIEDDSESDNETIKTNKLESANLMKSAQQENTKESQVKNGERILLDKKLMKTSRKKSKREKSKNTEKPELQSEFLCPSNTEKVEKTKSKTTKSSDNNGELSDASVSKTKIFIKKEESVFFGNIKIKQELHSSDIEFLSSTKRKHQENVNSSNNKITPEDISIKSEKSVVKSEPCGKNKKIKSEDSPNDSIVKNETDITSTGIVKSKKKTKTTFSE